MNGYNYSFSQKEFSSFAKLTITLFRFVTAQASCSFPKKRSIRMFTLSLLISAKTKRRMWDKSKNRFCYRFSNNRRPKVRVTEIFKKKRLGQKCLTPRNKPKFTKIIFQIFVNFGLFKKELLLLPPFIRF
ncbi:hypothetical protein EGW35_02455 [Enterococcus durans]|nr:hypothetical protein F6X90_09915 [Enterococcus durans]KAA9190882.1 hypothetical protein F6X87_12795 [Enterococcus durans]ROX84542.1 hypothetical protein EGW35_02455 [Enterococcus durans]